MTSPLETRDSSPQSAPSTYKFSTYEQLQAFLKVKGWENDQVWALFRGTGVPQNFSEISLTEEQLTDLAKRLQEFKTRFEQQNLLRSVVKNKLREEIDSITFASPNEVCEALKQRGVDYPYDYLSGDLANSSFLNNFKGPRTLSRSQYEKLITDLMAINGTDALSIGKRGELIRGAFLGNTPTLSQNPAGGAREGSSLSGQRVLIDEFYPSREEATKKAFEGATGFPITVKYSEGGKSYEYQITTSGNKMNFGGKEIVFSHKTGTVASIALVNNEIGFFDAAQKQLFAINKRMFGDEVLGELLKNNNPKLALFGDIKLEVAGNINAANIRTPQIEKDLSAEELRAYIFGLAKKELEGMTSNVENITLEELEQKIQYASALLDFKWLEKVPGMKDKVKEIMKFDIMMEGAIGAGFISMLEKQGYKMGFVRNNQVAVVHASRNLDAKDFESKINMHLSSNPRFMRMIQTGMLYRQPSFETYRQSVTDAQGKLIDPEKTNIINYVEYLSKRRGTLTESETLFLRSARHFDRNMPFASIVTQGKDYQAVMGLMSSMTSDESVRGLLGTSPSLANPGTGTGPNRAESPALAANAPDGGGSDGPAGLVGQGIGKIGGLIGKVGEAGIGGGMKILGEIFREANKAGGGYGTLAVIGLIGYSIFGKKGLGFWGTMGAFFGLGIADTAARGGFKGMLSGTNTPGSNPAGTPPAPNTPAAAAAVANAPGGGAANRPAEATPVAPTEKPYTESTLIAQAMGRTHVDGVDVGVEKSVIGAVNNMNFVKLQAALNNPIDEKLWLQAINSGYKEGTPEFEAMRSIIKKGGNLEILGKLVSHLANNEFIKALTPEKRTVLSLAQAMEYIVKKENEKKVDSAQEGTIPVETANGKPPPQNIPRPEAIIADNKAYGDIVVASRMVEYGYMPKVTYTPGEIIGSDSWMKRFSKGALWAATGGPVGGSTPGAKPGDPGKSIFSGKWRQAEVEFYKWLSEGIKTESTETAARAQALPNEPSFDPLKKELADRKAALGTLQTKITTGNKDEIRAAMKAYRESVKTPFFQGRLDTAKFSTAEAEKIRKIEEISGRMETEYKEAISAQEKANAAGATEAQRKEALEKVKAYNTNRIELERAGIKSLSELTPAIRSDLAKSNPWVARITSVNGGLDMLNAKLAVGGNHFVGRGILGVGIFGLLWNHKGSLTELWNRGDFETLSKRGFDIAAGMVPIVSSLHETAMLSNAGGYRDWILGKDYQMGALEKGFRVVGAVPLGGVIAKTAGRGVAAVGESTGVLAARTAGRAVEGVTQITLDVAKTAGHVGTYGVLGYSAYELTYDLFGKEPRPDSMLAK